MNTRGIALEYRLSHWAGIIRERGESGLTIRAYCDSIGIQENSYYYWLRKLREAASNELSEIVGDRTGSSLPVFAEVKLGEGPVLPTAGSIAQNHVCIETGGVRLTAGSDYPIDKLTELLRAVSRAC